MTSVSAFEGSNATLCQIFVIFRHGERAPVFIWPSDPDTSISNWPNGTGSLTNKGKEQGYLIGRLLRKMYPEFLGGKYLKDEIYVHSTNTDRTIMTALCCLAGLYPPKDDDIWLAGMPWQPIPVNTLPEDSDPFGLKFDQYDLLPFIEREKTPSCIEHRIIAEHKNLVKAISDKSTSEGFDGTLLTLTIIFDEYLKKAKQGHAYMPPGIEIDLQTGSTLLYTFFSLLMNNQLIQTASAHYLKDVLTKAKTKIEGKIPTQKAFLYSSHDILLNTSLALLNISQCRASYGATIIFELHKNPENREYYMKIMLKDNIESPADPHELPLNGSTMIPFLEFQKKIQGINNEKIRINDYLQA